MAGEPLVAAAIGGGHQVLQIRRHTADSAPELRRSTTGDEADSAERDGCQRQLDRDRQVSMRYAVADRVGGDPERSGAGAAACHRAQRGADQRMDSRDHSRRA
jgi:hypothetical protein